MYKVVTIAELAKYNAAFDQFLFTRINADSCENLINLAYSSAPVLGYTFDHLTGGNTALLVFKKDLTLI